MTTTVRSQNECLKRIFNCAQFAVQHFPHSHLSTGDPDRRWRFPAEESHRRGAERFAEEDDGRV